MHLNLKLVDWLTLFALISGPVMAVGVQLWFTRRQEVRQRQLSVLDTLLAYRGRVLHSDSVRALNTVPLVFYQHEKVREKFRALITSFSADGWNSIPVPQQTITNMEDALTELLSEMAKVLKYDFDHTEIKGQAYVPRAYGDEQKYQLEARAALLPILRGESSVHVVVDNQQPATPAPDIHSNNQPHRDHAHSSR